MVTSRRPGVAIECFDFTVLCFDMHAHIWFVVCDKYFEVQYALIGGCTHTQGPSLCTKTSQTGDSVSTSMSGSGIYSVQGGELGQSSIPGVYINLSNLEGCTGGVGIGPPVGTGPPAGTYIVLLFPGSPL